MSRHAAGCLPDLLPIQRQARCAKIERRYLNDAIEEIGRFSPFELRARAESGHGYRIRRVIYRWKGTRLGSSEHVLPPIFVKSGIIRGRWNMKDVLCNKTRARAYV
jgi:hypothetical protein